MDIIKELLHALWAQDYETLADPSLVWAIYLLLFVILFGEWPASCCLLPGDSLLILVGVLIAKGAMSFPVTLVVLTTAASLGCWVLYSGPMAGEYESCTGWLSHLPAHYHQRAHNLFTAMGYPPCWLAVFWHSSGPYCQPLPVFQAWTTPASNSLTG